MLFKIFRQLIILSFSHLFFFKLMVSLFLVLDWAYGYYRQQRKLVEEIGWSYTGKLIAYTVTINKNFLGSVFVTFCKRNSCSLAHHFCLLPHRAIN